MERGKSARGGKSSRSRPNHPAEKHSNHPSTRSRGRSGADRARGGRKTQQKRGGFSHAFLRSCEPQEFVALRSCLKRQAKTRSKEPERTIKQTVEKTHFDWVLHEFPFQSELILSIKRLKQVIIEL